MLHGQRNCWANLPVQKYSTIDTQTVRPEWPSVRNNEWIAAVKVYLLWIWKVYRTRCISFRALPNIPGNDVWFSNLLGMADQKVNVRIEQLYMIWINGEAIDDVPGYDEVNTNYAAGIIEIIQRGKKNSSLMTEGTYANECLYYYR